MANRPQLHVTDLVPATLVDTCVLLDVLKPDPTWAAWSAKAIADARDAGSTMINAIIYAEVSASFNSIEEVNDAVPVADFDRLPLPYEAGFLASRAYVAYRRRGGNRRSPLPDFYIGAHAAISQLRLLTRDAARFRTYFPTVDIIAPE